VHWSLRVACNGSFTIVAQRNSTHSLSGGVEALAQGGRQVHFAVDARSPPKRSIKSVSFLFAWYETANGVLIANYKPV